MAAMLGDVADVVKKVEDFVRQRKSLETQSKEPG